MADSRNITPLTASDAPAAVELLYLQKLSLALNRLMWKQWPDEASQKARIGSAVEGSLIDPSATCLKIADKQTADFLGILVLTRRGLPNPTENKQVEAPANDQAKPQLPPADLNSDVLDMVVGAVDSLSKGSEAESFFEVTALVVKQSVRRSGLGTQLMQAAFAKAREDGVPLVVNSEPDSNEFFVKLGFQEGKHCDMDLSKFAAPFSGFGTFRLARMTWSP